uniref:Uncharacterized protein n=1 Tax=Arundo donax TaxID=35708 RepID=A0A0A9CEC4_ARUDO
MKSCIRATLLHQRSLFKLEQMCCQLKLRFKD